MSTGRRRRVPAGFNGRWTRRQWAHASLFATLAALVAAIVPGFPANSQAAAAPVPTRTTLALTLQEIGPPARAAIPALVARLEDGHPIVSRSYVRAASHSRLFRK